MYYIHNFFFCAYIESMKTIVDHSVILISTGMNDVL